MATKSGVSGTQSGAAGSDGFFSRIGDSVARTFEEYLPRWTAKQLGFQERDQLKEQTFRISLAPPRADDTRGTSQNFTGGIGPVDSNTLLIIGGAAAAGLLIALVTK